MKTENRLQKIRLITLALAAVNAICYVLAPATISLILVALFLGIWLEQASNHALIEAQDGLIKAQRDYIKNLERVNQLSTLNAQQNHDCNN